MSENKQPEARRAPIGAEEVRKARKTLEEYAAGKRETDTRIIQNELWSRMAQDELHHADHEGNPTDPAIPSAYALNSLHNFHADLMTAFPGFDLTPREETDKADADLLRQVLPVVLDRADFRQAYSAAGWDYGKKGTGIFGIFWDPARENGLGDISIKAVDPLRIYPEPGIRELQHSRNVFVLEAIDGETLREAFPEMEEGKGEDSNAMRDYVQTDSRQKERKKLVVDWYYKKAGKLHFCKFSGDTVLFATENEPEEYPEGWLAHGLYPFEFVTMYPFADSLFGLGKMDLCRPPQKYIDGLGRAIMRNALQATNPRIVIKEGLDINEKDLTDPEKSVVRAAGMGNLRDAVQELRTDPLSGNVIEVYSMKVQELKETSGNRDFVSGGTTGGVSTATGIMALQESGMKVNNDAISAMHQAAKRMAEQALHLMGQFYTETRYFRIIGPGGEEEYRQAVLSRALAPQTAIDPVTARETSRVPVYDIRVTPQKDTPINAYARNERAERLYGMGFFSPANAEVALAALEMMEFDGIERVKTMIRKNADTMRLLQEMALQLDRLLGGSMYSAQVGQRYGLTPPMMPAGRLPGGRTAEEEARIERGGIAGRRAQLERRLDEVKQGNP